MRDEVYGARKVIRRLKPNTTEDGRLACAFGEYWLGPHPLCQAEVARICGCEISDVSLPDYSRFDVPIAVTQGELFAVYGAKR